MLIFISLFCVFPKVASETRMTLFWGVPTLPNECQNFNSSWNECYQNCYENESCLLSFLNGSICYTCGVNTTNSITYSNSPSGYKVALKYDVTTCPGSIQNVTGIIRNNITISGIIYNILGTSDGISLNISYQDIRCPNGYKFFQRIKCGWCIKVVNSYSILYDAAETQCASDGAVLTGMENMAEHDYIEAQGSKFIIASSSDYVQIVWVDGERYAACNTTATLQNCQETFQDAFLFKDSCASSLGGYISLNPPDGNIIDGVPEGCLSMTMTPNGYTGYVNDESCAHPDQTIGFACGRTSYF